MQRSKHTFLQILQVPKVELWFSETDKTTCKAKGTLEVLYSKTLKFFILRLKDFKLALDKSLQVIGTSNEKEKYHSYLFPNPNSFYIIKALDSGLNEIAIKNFETILMNTTKFLKRGGMEERLGNLSEEGTMEGGLHKLQEVVSEKDDVTDPNHPNLSAFKAFEEMVNVESSGLPVIDIGEDERKLEREAKLIKRPLIGRK